MVNLVWELIEIDAMNLTTREFLQVLGAGAFLALALLLGCQRDIPGDFPRWELRSLPWQ